MAMRTQAGDSFYRTVEMDGKGKSQSEWSGVRATGIFRLAGGPFSLRPFPGRPGKRNEVTMASHARAAADCRGFPGEKGKYGSVCPLSEQDTFVPRCIPAGGRASCTLLLYMGSIYFPGLLSYTETIQIPFPFLQGGSHENSHAQAIYGRRLHRPRLFRQSRRGVRARSCRPSPKKTTSPKRRSP